MTRSLEQSHVTPAQPDSLPPAAETFEMEVWKELNSLTEEFGEHSISGPSSPEGNGPYHTTSELEKIHDDKVVTLTLKLKEWSLKFSPEEVYPLICLWREGWQLWDATLAYRTLRVVEEATARFVNDATAPEADQPKEGWEHSALCAVGSAMSLITADADVFKQINLSSAEGLADAAKRAVGTTERTLMEVRSPLATLGSRPRESGDGSDRIAMGLREIETTAHQSQIFYAALGHAAKALIMFESWLATAPRLGSAQPFPSVAGPSGLHLRRQELLASIDTAIDQFVRAQNSLSGLTLSRCEPWERLLVDIRKIVAPSDDTATVSHVFIPKRVSIRYCYPFAVEGRLSLDGLKPDLKEALEGVRIHVGEPKPLVPTEFFAQGSGLYGGLRVDLPDIELRYEQPPGTNSGGRPGHCRVWIDLSHLGNHCLCIEPEPLDAPLPYLLYRALRAGTPFALGAIATLAEPIAGTEVAWDNLHSFSRDVIQAVVNAKFWDINPALPHAERSARGNLHEIVTVRTDRPLGTQPEEIADVMDRAIGGRIVLRSIQRGATTLEEWVLYPPVRRTGRRGRVPAIADMPEMGLAGDWCTHTGETTVFGIVAAPSWHSDVYVEAAQFVSSWSPLLRLWSRRLLNAIQSPEWDADKEIDAEKLRRIERQVRLHLAQIRAEELCATLAHRRFLDQLLEMAGLGRLQGELEAQLEAAEHLTDWFNQRVHEKNEERRQLADSKRQVLLGVIAVFGLFDLGTFLSLANSTNFHERFLFITVRQGVWEDWLVLILFVLALLSVGIYLSGMGTWWRQNLSARRKLRREQSGPRSGNAISS
jgi:hypothetical protein